MGAEGAGIHLPTMIPSSGSGGTTCFSGAEQDIFLSICVAVCTVVLCIDPRRARNLLGLQQNSWEAEPEKCHQGPLGSPPWTNVWIGLKRLGTSSQALVHPSPHPTSSSGLRILLTLICSQDSKIKFFCIIKLSIWLNIL